MAATYFADTSFWIALTSRRDQHHIRAKAWSRYLGSLTATLVTTEPVLWEWMNALADVATRGAAADGYRLCHRDPFIEVIPFSPGIIDSAVRLYEGRGDKNWSLTDCYSFVVIADRSLVKALTSDHHFEQVGARAVLLEDPPV